MPRPRKAPPRPSLVIFAGPNGSGKTTLTNRLRSLVGVGVLVNADQIAARMAAAQGLEAAPFDMQWKAAMVAEEMRWELVDQGVSLTTETVMSDSARWLKFFAHAKARGYRLQLIFITTSDPAINVGRVQSRVRMGGHPVDPQKIVSRYHKTMAALPDVLRLVDEGMLFDNSVFNDGPRHVLTATGPGKLMPAVPVVELPAWAMGLLAKL